MKWFVLILSFSLSCLELRAQSDYYERQARSHQSDAAYYVKQAQGCKDMTGMWNTICARQLATSEMQNTFNAKNITNRHGVHYVKHEMQLREQMTISERLTMLGQMQSLI